MTREIDTTSSVPARTTRSARRIVHRTSGHPHGGITRLMSPGDLGERVKPFVFLDHFELDIVDFPELPMHPHAGISTHTTLMQGGLYYEDSTGKSGHLEEGSVECMQAQDDAGLAGAREVAARPRPPRRAAPAAGAGFGGRPDLAGRFAEVA
jgi:hypothetical protein